MTCSLETRTKGRVIHVGVRNKALHIHINQADGSSCGNSEKIRNCACGTISTHCLILCDSLFGSLATYLCADALFLQNQPSNLIAALQTMAAQSETCKQMETVPWLDGTNYHQWSFRITAGLRTLDLWLVTGAVAPQYQACPVPANVAALTVEERARIATWDSANERSIGFLSGAMEEAIARRVQDAAETAAGAGNQVTAQHWWDQAKHPL